MKRASSKMMTSLVTGAIVALGLPGCSGDPDLPPLPPVASAQSTQQNAWDYWAPQREMIQRGVQAILQCNGLFTSHRPIDLVFQQELAYLPDPIGTAEGGDYEVDEELRAVAIGAPGPTPTMRAATLIT